MCGTRKESNLLNVQPTFFFLLRVSDRGKGSFCKIEKEREGEGENRVCPPSPPPAMVPVEVV